jgi:hypothetical protein
MVLPACGGGENASEDGASSGENVDRKDSAQAAATVQSGTSSIVVQMTGLLLVVPPKANGGSTRILMPRIPNHLAWIAFRGDSTEHCIRYDQGTCYVKMDGWALGPIGGGANSGNAAPSMPRALLSLSDLSRHRINYRRARARARGEITLSAGNVTHSCSLTKWTLKPVGNNPQTRRDSLVNLMEWTFPDFPAGSLVLARRRLTGPDTTLRNFATVHATGGRIELLITHVPPADTVGMFPSASVQIQSPSNTHREDPAAVKRHVHAFYDLMGVSTNAGKRPVPVPDEPPFGAICPITILGLSRDSLGIVGTKTPSCIMASAEEEP